MPDTTYRPADSDWALLGKAVAVLGGVPAPGDSRNALLRKLLARIGGGAQYRVGDSDNLLLQKILTRTANGLVGLGQPDVASLRPFPGDADVALWRKIVTWVGGAPRPGDMINNLLRQYLTRLNAGGFPI